MVQENFADESGRGLASQALEQILADCLAELRVVARDALASERLNHTLQPTALVNEFWLRVADREDLRFESHEQFLAYASRVIRHVLIDHGRHRRTAKNGGGLTQTTDPSALDHLIGTELKLLEGVIVADLLDRLYVQNFAAARVAELRYFGGVKDSRIAEIMGVSVRTVRTKWAVAKAWLASEMADDTKAHHAQR